MVVNVVILALSAVLFGFYALHSVKLLRATKRTPSKPTSFFGGTMIHGMLGFRLQA